MGIPLGSLSLQDSTDPLAKTIQRLGRTLVNFRTHPRFGTRNFILPLQNVMYAEVVCPLDHPTTDVSLLGKTVSRLAAEGGSLLTWIVSLDDISEVEKLLGREAANDYRTKSDGYDL